jgi:hypothetical protein
MVAQLLYKETQVMARLQEIVDAVAEEGIGSGLGCQTA